MLGGEEFVGAVPELSVRARVERRENSEGREEERERRRAEGRKGNVTKFDKVFFLL